MSDMNVTIQKNFLRSKVGRRIFTLFIISALVPIVFLAALYQVHGRNMLIEQAYGRLHETSAAHGESVYDRLVLADNALQGAVGELKQGASLEHVSSHIDTVFRSLQIIRGGKESQSYERVRELFSAMPEGAQRRVSQGGATLVTRPLPGQQASIYLLRAIDPSRPAAGIVAAEIEHKYLWTERDSSPHQTELCVFDQHYARLSCSGVFELGILPSVLLEHQGTSSGALEWENDGRTYIGNFREVFLDATFGIPGWIIVVGQPKKIAIETLGGFTDIFWPSLGVSLLLTVLLSLTQIRRTMGPLEKLTDATARLGEKDFSTKIHVDSGDEFQQLSDSFNAVTARLGRQFDVMSTLSAIDRAILFDLNIDRVVEEVLLSVRAIYKLPWAGIAVLDRDNPEHAQVFSISTARARALDKQRQQLRDARRILLAPADGYWTKADDLDHPAISVRDFPEVREIFNLPIASKSGIGGLMMLAYEQRPEFGKDDLAHMHDFADRVGVALSAVARDEQLFRQARYDSLTGLPNRFLLIERLKQEAAHAQRTDKEFAVLYIDLDRFKQVNDTLGHAAGDTLLQEAAHRLRSCVRESDTVARVGGDEFTIVMSGFGDAKVAATVAGHIITAMDKPFVISGTENFVSASIGIAMFPRDGSSPNELLRNADTAMYRAKASGRSTYVFFEEDMNAEVVRIATLDRELRRALSENQLTLHYQPQIDLRSGTICGAEALVRWNHPQRGLLKPGTFIDFAEDSGLIVALGQFVLSEACQQYVAWRNAGIDVGHIAVNVSSRQFRQTWFADSIEEVLQKTGMPTKALTLEITENVVIDEVEEVSATLARLKKTGIRIEIDDFGTGYSSMSYLETLPIDTLKIDRAFITTIDAAGRGGVIAKLVLDMARSLGKTVVAEGIEKIDQLHFLQQHECDVGQGFLFSEPVPPANFSVFTSRWNLVTRAQYFPGSTPQISESRVK